MRKLLFLLFVLHCVLIYPIVNEEQARELFSQALLHWYQGDVSNARNLMEQALSGLIYVADIPEFWFFTSKIDIDTRAVEKAQENLKTVLVVSPGKAEVLSLIKEIEVLSNPIKFSTPTVFDEILTVPGFTGGVEYFYTPNAVAFYENSLLIADEANKRLIRYEEGKYQIYKISISPRSIAAFPESHVYISGDGKLIEYDLQNLSEKVIGDGFINPILAGFDRVNRLWGADVDRIFTCDGGKITFFNPEGFHIIGDIEITPNGIWILDTFANQLILLDYSMNVIKTYPSYNAWNFEISLSGEPVIIIKNGTLSIVKDDGLHDLLTLTGNTVLFEYHYPYLMLMDWKSHSVSVRLMKSQEPVIVKVDNLSLSEEYINLSIRVENISGEPLPFIRQLIQVREGGGPVFFNISANYLKLEWLKATSEFFSDLLPKIKRGSLYGVLFDNTPKKWKRTDLVTLRGKNIKLFSRSQVTDLELLSGGFGPVNSEREIWQPVWSISFKRTRPIPSDIVPVAVEVKIGQEVYSDTIYYTRGMVE